MTELAERDPRTRRRTVTEHHTFEVTMDVNFEVGRRGEGSSHKEVQIAGTIFNLIQRYRAHPGVQFVYHIIAPEVPPRSVLDYIERQLRELRVTNVRFVWGIVGRPGKGGRP